MSARDALLELLTEGMSPSIVSDAVSQLKKHAAEEFSRAGVSAVPEAHGTSRRLVLLVRGVPSKTPRGALSEIFPRIIGRLQFPRAMSWDLSGFRFVRPIRGLLALHGEKIVPFSLAGLKSGRVTRGHEASGGRSVTVSSAEKYFRSLEHASVLAEDPRRLRSLRDQLDASSRRMKLRIGQDEKLLRENLYLAEYPVCVISGFSQEYLSLSPDKIESAFRGLSFFGVFDADGRRQPYFAGVRDGASKGQRNVEEGFRRALEARLEESAKR